MDPDICLDHAMKEVKGPRQIIRVSDPMSRYLDLWSHADIYIHLVPFPVGLVPMPYALLSQLAGPPSPPHTHRPPA